MKYHKWLVKIWKLHAVKSKYAEWKTNIQGVLLKTAKFGWSYVDVYWHMYTFICTPLHSQMFHKQISRIIWGWKYCKNFPANWKSDYLPSWLFAYLLREISAPVGRLGENATLGSDHTFLQSLCQVFDQISVGMLI